MKFGIGQAVTRSEDRRFLTGSGRYSDDLRLPGQRHAFFLRSPFAHARIRGIDTHAAKAKDGVVAVVTAADCDGELGDLPCLVSQMMPLSRADGTPIFEPPHRPLAGARVRHVGEAVAMVIADDAALARDAAELIAVDYEALPAVVSVRAAGAAGAPAVWDGCPDNTSFDIALGDRDAVAAAFARADHVVELSHDVNRVAANPMEPRAALADYDAAEDRLTLWTGNQSPHDLRRYLAEFALGIPLSRLRVVSPDLGGGFGVRSSIYPELVMILWAARRLRCPVKWTAERGECFVCEHQARDNAWDAALALDAEGGFLALRVASSHTIGAYLGLYGPVPAFFNIGGLAGPYRTPAIAASVRALFTHTPPISPYRGAGRPEASFVIETLIDLAAARLGVDRVKLRRRNMIAPEALPFRTGLTFIYDCGRFAETMDKALATADITGFAARRQGSEAQGRLRGLGIANAIEQSAGAVEEYAAIRFGEDGSAIATVGTSSHGQGHETVFRQIVGERLGLAFERIRVVQGDTDKVPYGHGTYGSRSSGAGGGALMQAADRIIAKGKAIAAHHLEAAAADIEFADGRFAVAGTDRALALTQVAKLAFDWRALPAEFEPGLEASGVFKPPAPTFPNGTHVCEVEIDPETGRIALVRYTVCDDVGTVLNPLLLAGQIHGGVAQGAGQILMEDLAWEADSGQLLSGSFMDYAMPRAADFPAFAVGSNPVPTAVNPLGVKGAGEAGAVGALPCVANAVVDALRPLGVHEIGMPATPERVWRAIRAAAAATTPSGPRRP